MAAPSPADQLRRRRLPPAPTKAKNGAPKTTVRRAVQARPNSSSGRELARLDAEPLTPRTEAPFLLRLSRRLVDRGPVPAERHADGQEGQPDRDDMGLVPARRQLRRVPEDRPEGEEDGRREPDRGRQGKAPERPPAEPDVDRGQDREDRLVAGGEAPDRNERDEHESREWREREQATRDAVGRRDRQDVLEVEVSDGAGATWDRVPDGRLALEEGRRLPHEMVVVAIHGRGQVDGQRREAEEQADGDGQPAGQRDGGPWVRLRGPAGVRQPTLCYAPIHLPRSCRSPSR